MPCARRIAAELTLDLLVELFAGDRNDVRPGDGVKRPGRSGGRQGDQILVPARLRRPQAENDRRHDEQGKTADDEERAL